MDNIWTLDWAMASIAMWLFTRWFYLECTQLVGGLEHDWIMTFHFIYGMSSFPLTFIFFRGVAQPPTSQDCERSRIYRRCSSEKSNIIIAITSYANWSWFCVWKCHNFVALPTGALMKRVAFVGAFVCILTAPRRITWTSVVAWRVRMCPMKVWGRVKVRRYQSYFMRPHFGPSAIADTEVVILRFLIWAKRWTRKPHGLRGVSRCSNAFIKFQAISWLFMRRGGQQQISRWFPERKIVSSSSKSPLCQRLLRPSSYCRGNAETVGWIAWGGNSHPAGFLTNRYIVLIFWNILTTLTT